MRRGKMICLALAALLLLGGCGAETESPAALNESAVSTPAPTPVTNPYKAPDFADAIFHEELAEGSEYARIDLSAVAAGYVGVSAVSENRLKFQVIKDDTTYNYDLVSDGTPSIFPLQSGDGEYRFRVMENIVDSKYAELYATVGSVTLLDEFQPFLRPSDYVSYSADSDCVKKAAQLAAQTSDTLGVVSAVYDYVCANVAYDTAKAQSVQSGYLPDPDETLRTGRGICFDYASLAAAMLRSQGIPTKLIFGYVSPDGLYHAWNMFYTEQTGWVTVSYEVEANSWVRLDLTFAAGGAGAEFVGDGSNYSDLYIY